MSGRIVIAGHMCVDLTPKADHLPTVPGSLTEVGPLAVSLGGSVANTGRALAALGHVINISTLVGDDDLGRIAVDHVVALPNVHGTPTPVTEAATSYSIVLQPTGVDRSFWHHAGANAHFDGSGVDVTDTALLHVGYPSLLPALTADNGAPLVRLLQRAAAAGATTSLDLAVVDTKADSNSVDWARLLPAAMSVVDIASPSADDLRSALNCETPSAADFVEMLLEWGVAVAAVSDGEHGISLGTADADRLLAAGALLEPIAEDWSNARVHQSALPLARIKTTNGAGDAATAGFLCGILHGWSPQQALARAVATAAVVISGEELCAESVAARSRT